MRKRLIVGILAASVALAIPMFAAARPGSPPI
jgi:hypothetical protein